MSASPGHWYPVLSSRELRRGKPLAATRFATNLVFWRDTDGNPVCMPDRCPHRGAALSLGRCHDDAIACPFHGFRYDASGQCIRVPAEGDRAIPADLRLPVWQTREDHGYVWVWRGEPLPDAELPPLPHHPDLEGYAWAERILDWEAHYTRCVENVIDYSHLPFVHSTTIGRFMRDPRTIVEVTDFDGGFDACMLADNSQDQSIQFIYPNLWMNSFASGVRLTAVFVPVDGKRTRVYARTWYRWRVPGLGLAMSLFNRISMYLVFKDDLPVVASQNPVSVDDARDDKLVPSDACLLSYRRLRRQHQPGVQQFSDFQ